MAKTVGKYNEVRLLAFAQVYKNQENLKRYTVLKLNC